MPDRDTAKEILARLKKAGEESPVNPKASAPQLRWLASLLDTRRMNEQVRETIIAEMPTMTRKRAFTWIKELRKLPRREGRMI